MGALYPLVGPHLDNDENMHTIRKAPSPTVLGPALDSPFIGNCAWATCTYTTELSVWDITAETTEIPDKPHFETPMAHTPVRVACQAQLNK